MHHLTATFLLADSSSFWNVLVDWFTAAVNQVWPVLLLLFGLGLVIFVHELGHFLAAKAVGIKVEEFSLGFGPRLFGVRRGETDYRISAVPLGGYLKMLGQDDMHPEKRVDDERSYGNKSVGQRFLVIVSGVLMNLLCAAIMFIILFRFTGVKFQRPEVGLVGLGTPALKAGIQAGDTILAVDGKPVRDFGELTMRIALSHPGQDLSLRIRRPGTEEPFDLQVKPRISQATGVPQIGLGLAGNFTIYGPGDYGGAQGLKQGDQIIGLEYNGRRYTYHKFYELEEAIAERRTKPTNIIASRDGQELPAVMVRPRLMPGSHVAGMLTPARIAYLDPKSPASEAGLKAGDVIASFNDYPWPNGQAVYEIARLAAGSKVGITVLRAGKRIDLMIVPLKARSELVRLGLDFEPDYRNLHVANAYLELYDTTDEFEERDVPAEQRVDVPAGAELLALDGQELADWSDLIGKLRGRAGSKAKLSYSVQGKKESVSFQVPGPNGPMWRQQWRFFANFTTEPDEIRVKTDSLAEAVYIGMHKTWFWLRSVQLTLTRMVQGSIKSKALSGPLGIFKLGVVVARTRGPAHFFYFMAIIGVNLAFINFLPIPVLDGGHGLFLLIEKIKGSPVSVRVQTVATTIGLALIGVFLLFITYNDIFGRG